MSDEEQGGWYVAWQDDNGEIRRMGLFPSRDVALEWGEKVAAHFAGVMTYPPEIEIRPVADREASWILERRKRWGLDEPWSGNRQ